MSSRRVGGGSSDGRGRRPLTGLPAVRPVAMHAEESASVPLPTCAGGGESTDTGVFGP